MSNENQQDSGTTPGLYPIRAVAGITGVNPVTLRAWERRYGLVKPQRTPKGHRLYTDEDIERVQLILSLVDQGVAISRVKSLLGRSGEAPVERVQAELGEDAWTAFRDGLCAAASRLDVGGLESVHNEALSLYPEELVGRRVLQPVLERLGERRFADPEADAQWHFFRAHLRRKLAARLHHAEVQAQGPRIVMAGLPGDRDELDMLLLGVLVCGAGYRTLSLGSNVPLEASGAAARSTRARAALLFGGADPDPAVIHSALPRLTREAGIPVLVAGPVAERHRPAIEAAGAVALPRQTPAALRSLAARVPS